MVNPCPSGFCLITHYDDPYDGTQGRTHPACYRNRPVYTNVPQPNGTYREILTGESVWGWQSGYVDRVVAGESFGSLADLALHWEESGGYFNIYFTIDPATRAACFSPPSPSPSPSLGGNASPPPPPGKNMCGCDCNTIATIVEDKICGLDKGIKNHIDQRTLEELKAVNKMLQGMKIDLNLQPIIDRLNEVEANLWNGAGR